MKKKMAFLLVAVLVLTSLLAACSGSGSGSKTDPTSAPNNSDTNNPDATDQPVAKELEGTLEFWTFDGEGAQRFADGFMALHPKVKINVTNPGWNELPANLKNTIAAGSGAPDVAYIAGGTFAELRDGEGLTDLLEFGLGDYEADFPKGNWEYWKSLDGKKMLGMPFDFTPTVTFYRHDLLENAGYPSDPAELYEFMKDPNNVIEMGEALKAQGVYLFEFDKTPVDNQTAAYAFFDRDLNYVRNNDAFAQALDLSKKVKQLGLAMNKSAIWSDDGKALTSTGKVAMLFYGPWYQGGLADLGEDQLGKWKVTGLPLGVNAGGAGSTLVLPAQGKQKELAYEFVKWSLATTEGNETWIAGNQTPGFLPAYELDSYLNKTQPLTGDQKMNQVYYELVKRIEGFKFATPLDTQANDIFNAGIDKALELNSDSKAALQQIEDDTLRGLKPELEALKSKIGNQ